MSKEKILLDELNNSEVQVKMKQFEELLSIYKEEMKLKDIKISYYESYNKPLTREIRVRSPSLNINLDTTSDKLNSETRRSGRSINIMPTIMNINDIYNSSNLNEQTSKTMEDNIIKKPDFNLASELTQDSPPQLDKNDSSFYHENSDDAQYDNPISSDHHHCKEKNTSLSNEFNLKDNKRLKINATKDDNIPYTIETFENIMSPQQAKNNIKELRVTSQVESPRFFQMNTPNKNNIFNKSKPMFIPQPQQNSLKDLLIQNLHHNIKTNHKPERSNSSIHGQKLLRASSHKEDKFPIETMIKPSSPGYSYGNLFKKLNLLSSRANDATKTIINHSPNKILTSRIKRNQIQDSRSGSNEKKTLSRATDVATTKNYSNNSPNKISTATIKRNHVQESPRGSSSTTESCQKYSTLKKTPLQNVLNNYATNTISSSKSVYEMVIQKSLKDLKRIESSRRLKFN